MEDLTGHSESSRDEFLNDHPPSALHSTASVDETETQGVAELVESSEGALEVGEESDDIACTDTNAGEGNSSFVGFASGDLKSSEQGEAESQGSPTSSQNAGELEPVNKTAPAGVENDTNNEEGTTQGHLLIPENSGSTVEVSPTTESSKDASVSEGSESSTSSTQIDITTNALYSGFEVPGDEPLDMAAGTGSEAEKESADSRTAQEQQALESLYHIKWIKWKGINTPIITQNENGPCPLLAIVNVLLLQRRINLPSQQTFITSGQLMEYIGDCILEESPKRLSEGAQLNYEQNMHDAIAIMNKLQTGLDVNVKFTGVADFEFTPECIVFDLLSIGLYHGWLIDPQNAETVSAVAGLSYNQLVEKIIASKQDGAESQLVSEGLIGEAFLEQTASQLTYHGLCELNSQLKDDQLCVFFRNNHFCTMLKLKDELFQLVTDQGFLTEDRVIWESLTNVEGDGFFVDAEFRSLPVVSSEPPQPAPVPRSEQLSQEDQDYLIALSLVEEERSPGETQTHPGGPAQTQPLPSQVPTQQSAQANQELSDLQLAMQLQEEERREQQQRQQQQQQQQQQRTQPRQQAARGSPSRSNIPPPSQQQSSNSNVQRAESVVDKCVIL